MNKQQVKTLCEADDKLEWWAMVLFAEISELEECRRNGRGSFNDKEIMSLIRNKVNEFPRLVIQRSLELAEAKFKDMEKQQEQLVAAGERD